MMSEYILKKDLQKYINVTYERLKSERESHRAFKYGEYNYAFYAAIISTLEKEINELCKIFKLKNPLEEEYIYV